jgi:hypothetical protein
MDERLLGSDPKRSLSRRIWVETKKISNIAFPTMVARVTQFGMYVVTQAFIGHLGELNLAAYALIQIITVRFVNGIVVRFFIFLFFFFFFFGWMHDIGKAYNCNKLLFFFFLSLRKA